MCITPITIRNPNYGAKLEGLNLFKDCTSTHILVPCGHCPDCIALNQMEMVQRIQMESIYNYIFMGTITYDNEHLPILETEMGYKYRYADYKQAQDMIKRMRKNNVYGIPWRYVLVSERGGKYGRPHFHILQLFKKTDIGEKYTDVLNFEQTYKWTLFENWAINKGTKRKPIYENLSRYVESRRGNKIHKTYDWHYVNPILTDGGITDCAFYVLKYMLKGGYETNIRQALTLNYPDTYKKIIPHGRGKYKWYEEKDQELWRGYWNIIKSRQVHSLGFGLDKWDNMPDYKNEELIQNLKDGVKRGKNTKYPYPIYYHPERLLTFPLAHYYKNNGEIYTIADAWDYYYKNPTKYIDNSNPVDHTNVTKLTSKFLQYERNLKITERNEIADDFDELFKDKTIYLTDLEDYEHRI